MRLERSRSPNQRIVLSQRQQGWRKRIPLFTPLALAHFPEAPRIVPPAVRGRLPVEEPDKGDERWHDLPQFGQKSPARDTVVRTPPVQRDYRGVRPQLQLSAKQGCQRVRASARLQRVRGSVEHISPLPGKDARDQPPEGISSRNAADGPIGFAEGREAGQSRAATTSDGTSALAKQVPAYASSSKPSASCSSTCRCSARMPDRPGALPRLLVRKAAARLPSCGRGRRLPACGVRHLLHHPPQRASSLRFHVLPATRRASRLGGLVGKRPLYPRAPASPLALFAQRAQAACAGPVQKASKPVRRRRGRRPSARHGRHGLGLHQRSTQRRAQKTRHILQSGDRMTELRREINIIERAPRGSGRHAAHWVGAGRRGGGTLRDRGRVSLYSRGLRSGAGSRPTPPTPAGSLSGRSSGTVLPHPPDF